MTATIKLPVRRVQRDTAKFYIVQQFNTKLNRWQAVSKPYAHSTSAFAALGRLVQKDTLAKIA